MPSIAQTPYHKVNSIDAIANTPLSTPSEACNVRGPDDHLKRIRSYLRSEYVPVARFNGGYVIIRGY